MNEGVTTVVLRWRYSEIQRSGLATEAVVSSASPSLEQKSQLKVRKFLLNGAVINVMYAPL